MFIYSVERASGIWEWLGELRQLLLFGTTLADEKVIGEKLSNIDKRMEIYKKHFGNSFKPEDFQMFMNAVTPEKLENAVQKLIEQGVESVKISQKPFLGNIEDTKESLVEIKSLNKEAEK